MKVYIIPIDDSGKELVLERFLRDNGFSFIIQGNPPKTIFDCDGLEELRELNDKPKPGKVTFLEPDQDYLYLLRAVEFIKELEKK